MIFISLNESSLQIFQTTEVPGLKIIHFVGGLNFASRDSFKELFVQKIGMDPAAILRKRTKLREKVKAVYSFTRMFPSNLKYFIGNIWR